MRYLILSDIHGNWEALEAVFRDARGRYDQVLNCGDLVGYGPDPDRVVDHWRSYEGTTIVRGNHDKAVAGLVDMDWFNPVARHAVLWARAALKPDNLEYVASLPQGPVEVNGFTIVHGSPEDEDEYVIAFDEARQAAAAAPTGLTFIGHTHLQGGFFVHRNGMRLITEPEIVLEETATYLVNPGSVGQPRDGDPRAAYAIYDSESRLVEYRRVEYDVEATARKIAAAGLPEVLGRRLFHGH